MPIFGKLGSMQLHRLSQAAASKSFPDGEAIVQQGGPGDAMYIIEHGRCSASVEGVGTVQSYFPGDFFGELALLTRGPRAASVHAVGECVCLVLHAAAVGPILEASWGGQVELLRREELLQIAEAISHPYKVVKVWFQNCRARDRREGKLPALTAPIGMSEGLPVSMQFIGDAWDEASTLAAGAHLERMGVSHLPLPPGYVDLMG